MRVRGEKIQTSPHLSFRQSNPNQGERGVWTREFPPIDSEGRPHLHVGMARLPDFGGLLEKTAEQGNPIRFRFEQVRQVRDKEKEGYGLDYLSLSL